MSSCWKEQPETWPSFAGPVLMLTFLLEDIAAYVDFSVITNYEQALNYDDHLNAAESQAGYDHLEPIQ